VAKIRALLLRLLGLFSIGIFLGVNTQLLSSISLRVDPASNPYGQSAMLNTGRLNPQNADNSYPYTQGDTVTTDWENYQEIPDSFELAAENTGFQLFADKTTLAFKVVDRRSGYVWHSNLDEVGEDDKLNRTWTAFASSGISIDYLDTKAISKRASITNTDHTLELKPVDQGFEASVTFSDASITIVVIVKLEQNGVSVQVPFELIQEENPDFKLGILYVYPFFGATRDDSVTG